MSGNNNQISKLLELEGIDFSLSERPCNYFAQDFGKAVDYQGAQQVVTTNNAKVAEVAASSKPAINVANNVVKSDNDNKIEVKKVNSTFDAISSLAKRSAFRNPNKKFMSIDEIVSQAKEKAQAANSLEELKKAVEEFDGCSLKKMATNTVFCDGNPDSKVMVIGEAPGNHEDLQGIPFCGDSGKLLDAMFGSINMKRADDYYITNVLFWRPPGNRRPTDEELAMCRPFVERHIQLVDPKIIILVGATAMSAVLAKKDPVSKVRGNIIEHQFDFMERKVDNFVVFHPSYLMRQSSNKRIAWRDFLKLEQILKG